MDHWRRKVLGRKTAQVLCKINGRSRLCCSSLAAAGEGCVHTLLKVGLWSCAGVLGARQRYRALRQAALAACTGHSLYRQRWRRHVEICPVSAHPRKLPVGARGGEAQLPARKDGRGRGKVVIVWVACGGGRARGVPGGVHSGQVAQVREVPCLPAFAAGCPAVQPAHLPGRILRSSLACLPAAPPAGRSWAGCQRCWRC